MLYTATASSTVVSSSTFAAYALAPPSLGARWLAALVRHSAARSTKLAVCITVRKAERIMFVKTTTPAPASSTAAMQKYRTWQTPTGGLHSRNQAHHTQHRQLEHAPVHVAAPHVRQHAAVHPLLRRGVPIPDGLQQALVQRLPRKLPVLREARARVAGNEVAHASGERHTVQHANDTDHIVLHAAHRHRQCKHGAEEYAEMHRVRHDVRQVRKAHRRPRSRRVHAAPPLEGAVTPQCTQPNTAASSALPTTHPQRSRAANTDRKYGSATVLARSCAEAHDILANTPSACISRTEPSPPVTTTATAAAPATTPVIAERALATAGSALDAIVKDPSSTPLQPPDTATASQRMNIVSSAPMK
ncbi:hypothetical protein TcBrA4_0021570 [Trypanosoma cruzi]|nr:hypothetical protein TcBrA4_0021570 [Trypanosoma cruzi]